MKQPSLSGQEEHCCVVCSVLARHESAKCKPPADFDALYLIRLAYSLFRVIFVGVSDKNATSPC